MTFSSLNLGNPGNIFKNSVQCLYKFSQKCHAFTYILYILARSLRIGDFSGPQSHSHWWHFWSCFTSPLWFCPTWGYLMLSFSCFLGFTLFFTENAFVHIKFYVEQVLNRLLILTSILRTIAKNKWTNKGYIHNIFKKYRVCIVYN